MSNARSALLRRIALLCPLSVSSVPLARAQTVAANEGNIVFTTPSGETKQLTTSGRDSGPALSPDGKTVAFVRAAPEQKISSGSGDDVSEIWTVQSDGSGAGRLVTPRASRKMQEVIAFCSAPHFSTDGRRFFFQSTAWVTSEAVHVVDLRTRKEHFVCAGNEFEIVRSGEYRDCLLAPAASLLHRRRLLQLVLVAAARRERSRPGGRRHRDVQGNVFVNRADTGTVTTAALPLH